MCLKMPTASSVSDVRRARQIEVVHNLYRSAGMTRGELAKLTGLGTTVLVRLVADLVERGILNVESKVERATRGRPSELVRLDPRAGYVVAAEFGREHLIRVTLDACGRVVHHATTSRVPAFRADEQTLEALEAELRAEAAAAGISWHDVRAAGLALHDVVNARGEWFTQSDLEGEGLPVAARLQDRLQVPVVAEDVSRAFALAERRHGAAREHPDTIYLFVGREGVGSGIFVNGEILRSSSGVCGEVGHLVVVPTGGVRCACGNHGCLETVASHEAVVTRFLGLVAEGVNTSVPAHEGVDFGTICSAAGSGDKAAYLVLAELAAYLGQALASVINITGATHVVIGGQLATAGVTFCNNLASAIRRGAISLLTQDISVVYASLPSHAGAQGVALQALELAIDDGAFLANTREVAVA